MIIQVVDFEDEHWEYSMDSSEVDEDTEEFWLQRKLESHLCPTGSLARWSEKLLCRGEFAGTLRLARVSYVCRKYCAAKASVERYPDIFYRTPSPPVHRRAPPICAFLSPITKNGYKLE